MSVPRNRDERTTTTSSDYGVSRPLTVEDFVQSHKVRRLDMPTKDCPECKRGLYAVGIFVFKGKAVWHMKCPVHHTDFGVEVTG